jgi:glyceraldehyde-3-phosphate dehydrogenase type I
VTGSGTGRYSSPAPASSLLLRHDSVHGRLAEPVDVLDGKLVIGERTIPVLREKNPADLPWAGLNVDVVVESTGVFTDGKAAAAHLDAGARRVLISAPATNVDFTVVYGINDGALDASHKTVSNASCTTNCAAPLAQVLHQQFGVRRGLMNTSHVCTSDQRLQMVFSPVRRASRPGSWAQGALSPGGVGHDHGPSVHRRRAVPPSPSPPLWHARFS